MNRLKERLKSETQKYQQKILGFSDTDASPASSSGPSRLAESPSDSHKHVDVHKLHFDAIPTAPTSNLTSNNENNINTNTTTITPPPIRIKSITHLGNITSLNTHIVRDLGFAGQIGNHILLSYGDTLYRRANTVNDLKCTEFLGMASNSIAFATHDPTSVLEPPSLLKHQHQGEKWPAQFVPVHESWGEEMATHSVGITNVIETGNNEGILYTLLNHRPNGTQHILGAGVARVRLDTSTTPPRPQADREVPFLWSGDDEPWYGDVGAIRTKSHIYAYGHAKDSPFVYLARVPLHSSPYSVSNYEYWHGQSTGWSKDRLKQSCINESQSVFWQVNQGQVIYSAYHSAFLFVYCDTFWSSKVLVKCAERPEGPWSETVDVTRVEPVSEGGTIYAAAPQVAFDTSGRTLVVGFTNHPNVLQAVRVEFE